MLYDDMKARVKDAMKGGRIVERDTLRLALSEIQAEETRGQTITDELSYKVIKKLIKSIQEALVSADKEETRTRLKEEEQLLEGLLPKTLDLVATVKALESAREAIQGASGEGPATGQAMKALKAQGLSVDGKIVADAVKQIRGV